jgi:rubrerythrin
MEDILWSLIQDEAEAITRYYRFLESDFAKTAEAEPFVSVVLRIVSEERDHLDALKYLYDTTAKTKAATDVTEAAKQAMADYREQNKLIK